jgi:hypothetical protein
LAGVTGDAGPAVARFDFTSGALRGSHFTLYGNCLVHRGDSQMETVPLAGIAALRVAYERDARKLGWGISLAAIALLVFAIAGPLSTLAEGAAAEMAAAGSQGVARALHAVFAFFAAAASLLPLAALACAIGGIVLGWLGWTGRTTLALDFAGSQRVYSVRGRNSGLLDFSEAVCERLTALKR